MVNKAVKSDTRKIVSFTNDLVAGLYPPFPTYTYINHRHLPLKHFIDIQFPFQ